MKLVVVGRDSLDELQRMVERFFVDIPAKKVDVPEFAHLPSPLRSLNGSVCRVVPVKEMRTLKVGAGRSAMTRRAERG
jgi:secreted Zn-dependent insulinase-like peptidase